MKFEINCDGGVSYKNPLMYVITVCLPFHGGLTKRKH